MTPQHYSGLLAGQRKDTFQESVHGANEHLYNTTNEKTPNITLLMNSKWINNPKSISLWQIYTLHFKKITKKMSNYLMESISISNDDHDNNVLINVLIIILICVTQNKCETLLNRIIILKMYLKWRYYSRHCRYGNLHQQLKLICNGWPPKLWDKMLLGHYHTSVMWYNFCAVTFTSSVFNCCKLLKPQFPERHQIQKMK